jgi:mannose-binding lectin 1
VVLPAYNFFGITAESDESPDSIEVFKFVTHNAAKDAVVEHHQYEPKSTREGDWEWAEAGPDHMDDSLATTIRDQQAQFADLHDRLQSLSHSIDNLFKELTRHASRLQTRMEDLNGQLAKAQHVQQLEGRVGELDNKIQQLRSEQKDWSGHFSQIENTLKSRHDALLASFPESMSNGKPGV